MFLYHVGVYDNNYPGEKRYLDIRCTENDCVTIPNKYYDSVKTGRIEISLSAGNQLEKLR